jgi:cytochrome P450
MEEGIRVRSVALVESISGQPVVDLRASYAARLPIQTMLDVFGLSGDAELVLRELYDSFESALANHGGKPGVAAAARANAARLRALFKASDAGSAMAPALTREELDYNLSIIFFGGISTVEALLLNTLLVLLRYPDLMRRVRSDPALLTLVIEETMRWSGPVQSATRHATMDTVVAGIAIRKGDTVNCMIGSANRDGEVFEAADSFNPDRRDLKRHLGFALGSHHCLGSHLARAEVRIAIETLLDAFPMIRLDGDEPPVEGHEFRQPRRLRCRLLSALSPAD